MHIAFLNQYYPPDAAPTGVMLQGVAEQLVEDGHTVTVLCASGGYAGEHRLYGAERYGQDRTGRARRGSTGGDIKIERLKAEIGEESDAEIGRRIVKILRIGATRFGRGTVLGKLADYFSYYGGVTFKLLAMRPAPDRIVAMTTPPYLSVLARGISKLCGADHAHWVMDLYPDVMTAHGMLKEKGVFHRVLAGLAKWGFGGQRCVSLLTLGPDMAARISGYLPESVVGRAKDRLVEWVPLWEAATADQQRGEGDEAREVSELRRARGWGRDELVVMYSGNMGLGHPMSEVLAAAETLIGMNVRFAFYGGGKRRAEIEKFVRENPGCPIEVHDYAPSEILAIHLKSADVHLVSLAPAWTGTMVPSKLQGIFAVARPAIFVGPGKSSIGSWVTESGGGWVVVPGNVSQISVVISEAKKESERVKRGLAAARFSDTHFNKTKNIAVVCRVLTVDRNRFQSRISQANTDET